MNITAVSETTEKLTNRELVTGILEGDKELYRILVGRYKDMVYHLALGILNDYDMAEEIAQRVFIKAYEHLARLKKPESYPAWIGMITKNMCRDVIRKKKNTAISLDYLSDVGIELAHTSDFTNSEKDLFDSLWKLISRLPGKYREIIDLRYEHEYSYKKIADFLNVSLNTVKSRIYHAKKEILRLAEKEGLI